MTKTSNGLPLTIPLEIPAYWTLAVVELLDDLRDRIWAHYSAQLLDQYREQYGPADVITLTISRSRQFDGREIEIIDGLPDSSSRTSVETAGTGTGKPRRSPW